MDQPVIFVSPKLEDIFVDRNINLTCHTDASPSNTYNWYKGDQFISQTATLLMTKIGLKDSGNYKCIVLNVGQSLNASVMVHVHCEFHSH